jgi:hypothetical protein
MIEDGDSDRLPSTVPRSSVQRRTLTSGASSRAFGCTITFW